MSNNNDFALLMLNYVEPFRDVQFEYYVDKGYIVWRTGTGRNIELLHIRTFEKGRGYGRELVYKMLNRTNPYHSVFGFTRDVNLKAQGFYGALGFDLQRILGLYKDGTATMFCQSHKKLVEKMKEWKNENSVRSETQHGNE